MASGTNKIHQPATCNESKAAHCSLTEECKQELHVKMCKKIAQLTKVIYALNNKTDEHEASIQALKEAHQEEMQRMLAETRETFLQYKCKVGEEQELRKRIRTLEETLEQYTRLKGEALAEFTMCKKQLEERELRTEAKEMADMKTDFENKLQHFNEATDSLVNECKQEKLDKKEIIDEKCSAELHALINEMEILKRENQKITEECAQKASKRQASYKKEKEPLKKAMQQSVAGPQKQCQQREAKEKRSSEAQEAALLQLMKKLEADLEVKGQNINESKKHSQKLKERLQAFQMQLEELKKNSENEIEQLEKEKEALRRKLQDSSLAETEDHLKKKYDDSIKIQHHSHRLEIQALAEKAKKAFQAELERIQKQQVALIETLRMEVSEQQACCTSHRKQMEELQLELKNVRALKKQQEESKQNEIKLLNEDLEKCQNEITELKKENFLLKNTMELLCAEVHLQKQGSTQLQDKEKQQRLLEEDLKVEHKKELSILKQDHCKEIQNMVSDFSSAQAHLQAKIISLETELKELEEKPRKQESRQEDMHCIGCLQNKLSEREEIIKKLTEGRKFQHVLLPSTESHGNRSISFNPNPGCLTPSMKQKKLNEVPTRVVSVPNLAAYAKNFLSCDLRSKRSAPPIAKSTSLDQSAGCLRDSYQSTQTSDISHAIRTHGSEAPKSKDGQKQDLKHQEWFTKHFSF